MYQNYQLQDISPQVELVRTPVTSIHSPQLQQTPLEIKTLRNENQSLKQQIQILSQQLQQQHKINEHQRQQLQQLEIDQIRMASDQQSNLNKIQDLAQDITFLTSEKLNFITEVDAKNAEIQALKQQNFDTVSALSKHALTTSNDVTMSDFNNKSVIQQNEIHRICEFLNLKEEPNADAILDFIEGLQVANERLQENLNLAIDRVRVTRDYEGVMAVNDVVRKVMRDDFSVRQKIRNAIEENKVVQGIYNSVQ